MKPDEIKVLKDWVTQLSEFNKNDLLVSIQEEKTIPFSASVSLEEIQKIISFSQNSIKESGINTLCTTLGVLSWEWKQQACATPIWIIPTDFTIDRVRKLVHLEQRLEDKILNPFFLKKLADDFQINIDANEELSVFSQLEKAGFTDIEEEVSYLGNFHHHRYAIIKELEEIHQSKTISPALRHYISGEKPEEKILELPFESILKYDIDHRLAFETIEKENCVIQGPPGTGKSQLLTNIVAKLVYKNHSMLVVSEKRSALEVIQQRLQGQQLHHFTQIATDDLLVKDFLSDLKLTWEELENSHFEKSNDFPIRKELEQNLQFTLDILNQPKSIGETSYAHFQQLKENNDLSTFEFIANPPSLPVYEQTLEAITALYNHNIQQEIASLSLAILQEKNTSILAERIEKTIEKAQLLEQVKANFTFQDLDELQHKQVIFQLFENEIAKQYLHLIEPQSKEQKRFIKLYTKYQATQKRNGFNEQILAEWKRIPSELELNEIENSSKETSFFSSYKFKKKWDKISHLASNQASVSIDQLKNYYTEKALIFDLEEKMLAIGITDISAADTIFHSLSLFTQEKWTVFQQFNEEEKQIFRHYHSLTDALKSDLKQTYNLKKNTSVLAQLKQIQEKIHLIIEQSHLYSQLQKEHLNALRKSETIAVYKSNVLGTHHSVFASHYPTISKFDPASLEEKIHALTKEEENENNWMANEIRKKIKQRFDAYQHLITQSTGGLNKEQKELRSQLKKGKALLIKEFAKTRQHPSIRELIQSEAHLWISLLKPIWLTNPVQLAKTHPLKTDLFDVCIMDEASQIPVANAVGSIQRSQRIVIAGDDKQMNPSHYFQAGSSEVTSVLQHAKYHFKNIGLHHHYRSKHSSLIAFSNKYFYENKLSVFPSFPINQESVKRHFCSTGRFINRKNEAEAKQVVDLLKIALKQNQTIGIVAFSQEQVDCIWSFIPQELHDILQSKMEENTFFIKPLEKIQGDECEQLIISLAYAPDENNEFHQRFGPLNQQSGKNRLNVLFSRASEQIDFVCSIESTHLKWSTNESIQLLHNWLKMIEEQNLNNKISLPTHLNYQENSNQILIAYPYQVFPNALELKTNYEVFISRGWEILFQ